MQASLVERALKYINISAGTQACYLRVWITINTFESSLIRKLQKTQWSFDLRIIQNPKPLGFGANHNQAFAYAQALGPAKWFCVMNPDVLWPAEIDAFWAVLQNEGFESNVGLVCAMQLDEHGAAQDFARHVPTPWDLAERVLRRMFGGVAVQQPIAVCQADWVNGACMLVRSDVYRQLGGFDERYFMYCEDADFCLRLQLAGFQMVEAEVTVVHDAQRNTMRKPMHLWWHVSSLLRFWCSAAFWRYFFSTYRKKKNR